ncbi:contractile injection system tape measure protein [Rhodovulum steppense]|uniref:Uncharacterized protein n=1 Tax=Rhodovulum steppense TaxID=540251 RepID=A0A4R1YY40_9RHOB|nr:contractile injection system tape measure protein [Rhodovulum steppense]TCM86118.1 hypothetical protein EV216_10583 [Rhodovulum steppense]
MSAARFGGRAAAAGPRHRIGEVVVEFAATSARGPLSTPEALLAAIRRELLPALDESLHRLGAVGLSAEVERLELDLGSFPADPDWNEVRAAFREALETALAPYLRRSKENPEQQFPAAPAGAILAPTGLRRDGAAVKPGGAPDGAGKPHQMHGTGSDTGRAAATGGPSGHADSWPDPDAAFRDRLTEALAGAGRRGSGWPGRAALLPAEDPPAAERAEVDPEALLERLLRAMQGDGACLPDEVAEALRAHPDHRAPLREAILGDPACAAFLVQRLGPEVVAQVASRFEGRSLYRPAESFDLDATRTGDASARTNREEQAARLATEERSGREVERTAMTLAGQFRAAFSGLSDAALSDLERQIFPDNPRFGKPVGDRAVRINRLARRISVPPMTPERWGSLADGLAALLQGVGYGHEAAIRLPDRIIPRLLAELGRPASDVVWNGTLAVSTTKTADLRGAWVRDRAAVLAEMGRLPAGALADWVGALAPADSSEFVESVRALRATADKPVLALRHVLTALLDGRDVDIEAARHAGTGREPPEQGAANQGGDGSSGYSAPEPKDMMRAWRGIFLSLGHSSMVLDAVFGLNEDLALPGFGNASSGPPGPLGKDRRPQDVLRHDGDGGPSSERTTPFGQPVSGGVSIPQANSGSSGREFEAQPPMAVPGPGSDPMRGARTTERESVRNPVEAPGVDPSDAPNGRPTAASPDRRDGGRTIPATGSGAAAAPVIGCDPDRPDGSEADARARAREVTPFSGASSPAVSVAGQPAAALAELRPTFAAVLRALPAPILIDWQEALALVWSALPEEARAACDETVSGESNAAVRKFQDGDGADMEAAVRPPVAPSRDALVLAWDDPRYWRLVLRLGLAPRGPDHDLRAFLRDAFRIIEPDPARRRFALRHLLARLGYPAPGTSPALRMKVLEALDRVALEVGPGDGGQLRPTAPAPRSRGEFGLEEFSIRAGLILFHPFLPLLFERLELLDASRAICPERLLLARAALQMLGDGASSEPRPTDPVERLLLGLPPDWTHPGTEPEDRPDPDLVEGLTRSLTDRWSALGNTSPEGLRETFIRRSGILRHAEDGPRLAVDPGPFDMLLDRLPWSIGFVALPWMAQPCRVDWR